MKLVLACKKKSGVTIQSEELGGWAAAGLGPLVTETPVSSQVLSRADHY